MRPSPLRCLAAGLFVSLFLSPWSSVRAQDTPMLPPPPPGGMTPPFARQSLVLQEAIQADLGLTEKQKGQLNSLQASLGPKSRELFQTLQESGADPQEFQEAMVSLNREHQASLLRVLDKTQRSRLAQIELQREGFMAAARSEIASKLKLNAQQTKKIKTILDEMKRENSRSMPGMLGALQTDAAAPAKSAGTSKSKKGTSKNRRPAATGGGTVAPPGNEEMSGDGEFAGNGFFGGGMPNGGGPPGGLPDFLKPEAQADFARFQEAQKKNREAASSKIGEVLTAEQKTAFEKLTGKPFDFSTLEGGGATAKAGAEAEPKANDAMKKDETPTKGQSKSKFKKANRDD